METFLDDPDHRSQLNSYWLRVREDRPVSDAVEEDLGVKHESPQAFLIRNGNALWHDSHDSITEDTLRKALQSEISKDG